MPVTDLTQQATGSTIPNSEGSFVAANSGGRRYGGEAIAVVKCAPTRPIRTFTVLQALTG
jgi:hypothetical protein